MTGVRCFLQSHSVFCHTKTSLCVITGLNIACIVCLVASLCSPTFAVQALRVSIAQRVLNIALLAWAVAVKDARNDAGHRHQVPSANKHKPPVKLRYPKCLSQQLRQACVASLACQLELGDFSLSLNLLLFDVIRTFKFGALSTQRQSFILTTRHTTNEVLPSGLGCHAVTPYLALFRRSFINSA
eukprot:5873316-Amphidinium_carterae.1